MKKLLALFALLIACEKVLSQKAELVIPKVHNDQLNKGVYSPDGSIFITISQDKSFKVWDARSGRLVKTVSGIGFPNNILFNPDGTQILLHTDDLTLFAVPSFTAIATLPESKRVDVVAFSSNGKRVIGGNRDGKALIWNPHTGLLIDSFLNQESSMNPQMVVDSIRKTRRYRVSIGQSVDDHVPSFLDNEKYILTIGHFEYSLWHGNSKKIYKKVGFPKDTRTIAFSPDRSLLAVNRKDNAIYIFDVMTEKLLHRIPYQDTLINQLLFSPDNKHLAITIRAKSTFYLCDLKKGTSHLFSGPKQLTENATFSKDSRFLIASGKGFHVYDFESNHSWKIYDVEAKKEVLAGAEQFLGMFSPGAAYALFVNKKGAPCQVNVKTGRKIEPPQNIFSRSASSISINYKGTLLALGENEVRVWDINTGRFYKTNDTIKKNIKASVSNIGEQVTYIGKPLDSYNSTVAFGGSDKYLLFGADNGLFYIYDAETRSLHFSVNASRRKKEDSAKYQIVTSPDGKLVDTLFAIEEQHYEAAISPDGSFLVTTSYSDSLLRIFDMASGRLLHEVTGNMIFEKLIWKDESHFVIFDDVSNSIKIFKTATAQNTLTLTDTSKILQFWFNNSDRQILYACKNGRVASYDLEKSRVIREFFAYPSLEKINWHRSSQFVQMVVDSSASLLATFSSKERTVRVWDLSTGKERYFIGVGENSVYHLQFGNDVIITRDKLGIVSLWDIKTGQFKTKLENSVGTISFKLSGDKMTAVSNTDGNSIHFWDLKRGALKYTLLPLNKEEYIVYDEAYRYDGTLKALKNLYFSCGLEIIELDQVKDLCWEPGLIGKLTGVNAEPITAKKLSEISICYISPLVEEIGTSKGKYNFRIVPRNGGIGEVLVFVNDKQIKSYLPSQLIRKGTDYFLRIDKNIFSPYFTASEENKIEVIAFTKDRNVRSQRGGVEVENSSTKKSQVNLFSISVGISKYKHEKLRLSYASKDAEEFSEAITLSAQKLLNTDSGQHVIPFILSTNQKNWWPTKSNIKKAFLEVAKRAKADDILVVFLAGHGVLNKANKQFYFLSQEASSLSIGGVQNHVAVSSEELNQWMREIKAQKQLLILDACNSGEVINSLQKIIVKREIPADQARVLERLRERTGTYILSASASGQSAYESSLYANGILTYTLLSGIKYGSVLRDNRYIDISKWFNFAADEVRVLAKNIGGRQDPQIFGNASFDLGIVDEEIMAAIKLSSKKKVVTKSIFVSNKMLLSDELRLGISIDQALKQSMSEENNDLFVFQENISGDNAYSIRGNYKVQQEKIIINGVVIRGESELLKEFALEGNVEEREILVSEIINMFKQFISKVK